jgi:serine-type D-Ala-D-Ala carboxypeptidase/endopeptidase (penicillin-binding protein 4)
VLRSALEKRGVHVSGTVEGHHEPPADPKCCAAQPNRTVLAQRLSPTLLQDVVATNKLSINLHAELMLRVAAKAKGGATTLDDALKFAEQFRQSIGIAPDDVQMTDGSGLSRGDLVTPQSVVQLLTWAARQKWGPDFETSLPVAGEDGTLENRLKGTAAAGRIRAKTGFVEHDEGLSGYATSVRGEHLVFSFFVNNLAAHSRDGKDALDSMCVAMVEELGGDSAGASGPGKRKPVE